MDTAKSLTDDALWETFVAAVRAPRRGARELAQAADAILDGDPEGRLRRLLAGLRRGAAIVKQEPWLVLDSVRDLFAALMRGKLPVDAAALDALLTATGSADLEPDPTRQHHPSG